MEDVEGSFVNASPFAGVGNPRMENGHRASRPPWAIARWVIREQLILDTFLSPAEYVGGLGRLLVA